MNTSNMKRDDAVPTAKSIEHTTRITRKALRMSSLIPERQLVISPSLAATIGLEESVLLQVLNDICQFTAGELRGAHQWRSVALSTLQVQLPFWNTNDLLRVSKSLRDKGILLVDATPVQQHQLRFAMNETAVEEAAPETESRQPPPRQPERPRRANLLAENWQPDEDLLQLLALNHGIPREFALQQLEDFILYWRDRQQVSHSWPSKFRQHVLKEWRYYQSRNAAEQTRSAESADIDRGWQPSEDAMEILIRSGIRREFIEDAIPEFVLYWSERGEASNTWNSKFIAHIRRQWARFTASLQNDYEPRPIPADWQPNEDVFDILRMANIELDFARQLIPEFVLFWRDTQQIQRSWNTKFLQHVKYQWATRHHYGNATTALTQGHPHARQPGPASGPHAANSSELRNSPFKQLSDRSWAEGIVDGI